MPWRWLLAAALLVGAGFVGWGWRGDGETVPVHSAERALVSRGELTVQSVHDGVVESRRVVTIASRFQGAATLVELVGEGDTVTAGDVLARFDASEIRTRSMKLEKDLAIARSELDSLENGRAPLKLKELELALAEARRQLDAEQDYLEDSQALRRDNMVSSQEVQQQQRKVDGLAAEVERSRLEFELTRDFLQPAELAKARTAVFAAEQSLAVAREQLAHSTVRAPADGVVVYKPLSLGNEFRRARVGDTLYPNQPFMVLPDMDDLVTVIDVPEAELEQIRNGAPAVLQPLAYPDLRLDGTVTHVGAIAQSVPGKPEWQKYFHVVIDIDTSDPRVRPGMSVIARVVAYQSDGAVLVPRRAVRFVGDEARVRVVSGDGVESRTLTLDRANLAYFEVLDGLEAGETVLLD